MADAFVIDISGITVGILAAEQKQFRFSAAHHAMTPLDGRMFKSLKDAQHAAARIAAKKFKGHFDERQSACRALF